MNFQRTSHLLLVVALLVGPSWVAPVAADTFTATWDYNLKAEVPDPSPFYDCGSVGAGGLICAWLWDQGLEVSDNLSNLPMYGDGGPFFDAFGFDLPLESDVTVGGGLLRIVPKCLDGIQPCFDTFTPLSMVADGYFTQAPGGVFFTSSEGGLLTTLNGLGNFAVPNGPTLRGWTSALSAGRVQRP